MKNMKLSRIAIQNYKSISKVNIKSLEDFCVLIGKNNVGKSNFLSALSFIGECTRIGDLNKVITVHGGPQSITYNGNISVDTKFDLTLQDMELETYRYVLKLKYGKNGTVKIDEERLSKIQSSKKGGIVSNILVNRSGKCTVDGRKEEISSSELAIAIFGKLKQYTLLSDVYNFFCNTKIINFAIPELRESTRPDVDKLSYNGVGIKSVAYRMYKDSPKSFSQMVEHLTCALGISDVKIAPESSGMLGLCFIKDGQEIPESKASDGLLSLFAYYTLLEQPLHRTILCIEEPERNLGYDILRQLAEVMRLKVQESKAQIFVTTHSPEFINALDLKEVYHVNMDAYNQTHILHLSEVSALQKQVKADIPLGELYSMGVIEANVL